ncbi:MAG: hypothetical protein RIK87_24465 [Fuerstiella sp.]
MKSAFITALLAGGLILASHGDARAHDNGRGRSGFSTSRYHGSVYRHRSSYNYRGGLGYVSPYISPSYSRVSPAPLISPGYRYGSIYGNRFTPAYGSYRVPSSGFGNQRYCR